MRFRALSLPVVALLAGPVGADTNVRTLGDQIEVQAQGATLADVLDTMARHIGMKVVYEGPAPRARVSFALPPMSPADAVLAALEGQGLTYAIRMDATGTRVETLMVVTGGSTASAGPPSRSEPRAIQHEETPEPEEEPANEQVQPQVPPVPGEMVEKPEREEGRRGRPINFPFAPTGPGVPGAPGGQAVPLMVPPPGTPPGVTMPPGMMNPNVIPPRPLSSPAPQQ